MLMCARVLATDENRRSVGSTIFACSGKKDSSVFLIIEYAEGSMESSFLFVNPDSLYPVSVKSKTTGRITRPLLMMARWNMSSESTFSGSVKNTSKQITLAPSSVRRSTTRPQTERGQGKRPSLLMLFSSMAAITVSGPGLTVPRIRKRASSVFSSRISKNLELLTCRTVRMLATISAMAIPACLPVRSFICSPDERVLPVPGYPSRATPFRRTFPASRGSATAGPPVPGSICGFFLQRAPRS